MRHPAVDKMDFLYARADRLFAAFDLRKHPARNRTVRLERFDGVEVKRRKERRRIVRVLEKPRHVGDERELARLERGGERGCGDVGVDVVEVRVGKTRPERRHDRYYAGVEHLRDGPRVDARDPPDIAPVRRLGDLLRPEEPVAVERPRVGAARLQAADDVGVDDVVQRAADDFHRRLVGDAEPADELRLVAGLLDRL